MGLRDSLLKATPKAVDSFEIDPLTNLELNPPDVKDGTFPLVNYQFAIKMHTKEGKPGSVPVALFQEIAGMTATRNIDELTEGGFNEYTFEFPREFAYNHITFKSGLTSNDFFYKWMMYGKEQGFAHGRDFVLEQHFANKPFDEPKSWYFNGAFPVKWSISDLSVTNSDAIVVETLELSFNFFELE